MSMRIKVDSGKYTFVQSNSGRIDILRHDQPWIRDAGGANAIFNLMAELDAARLVLAAVRECIASSTAYARSDYAKTLGEALDAHARLVSDTQPPSSWATHFHPFGGAKP
jgi:hypothetical protein